MQTFVWCRAPCICKLGFVVGNQVSRDPKTTYNVLSHKMLHLVSSYLSNWLGLNPLCEVLNGYHEVLHVTNCQKERTQDFYPLSMERPWAVDWPQLLRWCVVSISMHMTLLALLCMPHTILLHGRLIIPNSDDLQQDGSSSDMTPTNVFMELPHDAGILIPTYASEDGVGITMTKQISIYKDILPHIPLNCLCLYRFCREQTIS